MIGRKKTVGLFSTDIFDLGIKSLLQIVFVLSEQLLFRYYNIQMYVHNVCVLFNLQSVYCVVCILWKLKLLLSAIISLFHFDRAVIAIGHITFSMLFCSHFI